jgi:two-component system chemotaxis sensor kinase CheA
MASSKGTPLQFDLDDEDLKLFCDEAEEQLELLDSALVHLEGEPDPDLVQQIFRAAHTLKGSSATIGHKKMAQLTHAMETVLDAVRLGQHQPSSVMVDALLAGLDALRVLTREVVTRVDSGTETANLEADLLAILESDGHVTIVAAVVPVAPRYVLPPDMQATIAKDLGVGQNVCLVQISISPDCSLPSIRSYQLVQELDGLGRLYFTWPERSEVESGAGELELAAMLSATANEQQIDSVLRSVSDVAMVSIQAVSLDELASYSDSAPDRVAERAGAATPFSVVPSGAGPAAESARQAAPKTGQSVRIDVERLDGLMNLVGELVIDRTRLQQIREQLAGVLKEANMTELTENFQETTSHLARITDELQEEIMRSRMLPVRSVLTRLPRVVRDVAAKCGKRVELLTSGEETELDRSVIEEISDPLIHILRNAVDHGIESPDERRAAGKPEAGTITVSAWNQETYIYLSVKDDGKGIDTGTLRRKAIERGLVSREAAESASDDAVLQYIFFAGLSTAKTLSDVSGRGVGMDIVRTNIERLNGQVQVRSVPGEGSEFIIQLPLTLATTKALMVVANETVYALPLVSVTEALAEHSADIHAVAGGTRTLRLRGRLLPMINLAQALGDGVGEAEVGTRFVVAARHGERQVAFVVDRLLGEQDVVVKSLGGLIGNRKGLTGATILGDGSLGLIIDTASLITEQTQLAAIA